MLFRSLGDLNADLGALAGDDSPAPAKAHAKAGKSAPALNPNVEVDELESLADLSDFDPDGPSSEDGGISSDAADALLSGSPAAAAPSPAPATDVGELGLLAELERRGLAVDVEHDAALLAGGLVVTQDALVEGMLAVGRASLFDIPKLVVSYASKVVDGLRINDAVAQDAVAEYEFLADTKSAMLGYAPSSPSLMTPSCGYTFVWSGYHGGNSEGIRMKNFRMEHIASDRIEAEMTYDMKVVAPDMGVFLNTVVA